ncbi:HAMP domain-containing sensor histidine kinase [Shimia sp.]|uniref:sensor histidine kinase n=1 Tax=Shimia sp. TaxID=1954381 RepID=UPI0032975F09
MLRNARTRLIFASILLSSVVTVLVLSVVYVTTNVIIEQETRSVVEAEIAGLADDYERLGLPGLAAAIDRRVLSSTKQDAIYLLTDHRGRSISGNLGVWPSSIKPGGGWVELELVRTDSDERVPISAVSISFENNARLLVGRDASGRQKFDRILVQSAGWALIAAFVLSSITSWLLTRLIFSRISEISDTADTIVSGDFARRIPVRGTGDEFDRLAITLNDMLERIEELVKNLQLTTNSLAHDLRSPLTRLRTHLDTLVLDNADQEQRDKAGKRALEEVDHLLRVFANLTEIARAEARLPKSDFDIVDVDALVSDAVELYAPIGDERDINVHAVGAAEPIEGHRALLMQVLSNLLENALRHSPNNSEIVVKLYDHPESLELVISDKGPGMPNAFIQNATRPFQTLDVSRSNPGSGLGLALVAAVARMHDGDVQLKNANPGFDVTVSLARGHTKK